jgi:2-iminoacetate synthase ThiH
VLMSGFDDMGSGGGVADIFSSDADSVNDHRAVRGYASRIKAAGLEDDSDTMSVRSQDDTARCVNAPTT